MTDLTLFYCAVDEAGTTASAASRKSRLRRGLFEGTALAGGVLAAMLVLAPASVQAQNANWLAAPVDNDIRNGANYSTGVRPGIGDTITFGASTITAININAAAGFGSLTFLANAPAYTITATGTFGWAINGAGVVNGERLTIVNAGDMQINAASTLGAATVTNNNILRWNTSGTAGSATITTTVGSAIDGKGTRFRSMSNGGTSTHILTANGLLDITELTSTGTTIGSVEGTGFVGIGGKTLTIGSNDKSTTYSGVIQNRGNIPGSAALDGNLVKIGTGTLTLAGANSYSGVTTITAGTLQVGNGGTGGTLGTGNVVNNAALVFNRSDVLTVANVISGAGTLNQIGTGTLTLVGINTYTGTTMVNGGTMLVNGSIATSSGLTVNNGGTIGGTGTLPGTTIASGGTLAPGSNGIGTLSINGGLTLNAGATTLIEVQGNTIDRVNVTGNAALAGTVRFAALGGAYSFNSPYTFLQAGSITGTFGTKAEQGSFGDGVTTAVTYTGTEARLTLTPAPLAAVVALATQQQFASPQLGSGNQFRVASALDRAVANGANADAFFRLYNQNRAGILAGLDQLSGVAHSGAPALGTQAASGFLGAMLNPAARGRSAPTGGLISAYAPTANAEWSSGLQAINRAIGAETVSATSFRPAPIYTTWATITGGTGRVNGESLVGSPHQTSGFGGVSVGVDARIGPETIVGAAMSGAAGSTTSAGGQGKVDTNLFQLGLYGSTKFGALSLAASGAWLTGSAESARAIPVLGQTNVTSKYDLQGLSGRFEAAWAVASVGGVTASPFAAFQAASIRNSSFVEANEATGIQVGVAGLAKTNLTARTELGLKLETAGRLGNMPATAFLRAGWGHYTSRDAFMTGQLVGLPGSLFTVTGTRPERNVALLAAGGDVNLTSAISVGARLDAELGSRTQAVSGTANVKWAF